MWFGARLQTSKLGVCNWSDQRGWLVSEFSRFPSGTPPLQGILSNQNISISIPSSVQTQTEREKLGTPWWAEQHQAAHPAKPGQCWSSRSSEKIHEAKLAKQCVTHVYSFNFIYMHACTMFYLIIYFCIYLYPHSFVNIIYIYIYLILYIWQYIYIYCNIVWDIIFWYTMIYYDILWCIMIYYDILWYTMIYCDIWT